MLITDTLTGRAARRGHFDSRTGQLDTACSAIEKAAMERAVTDVDDAFATAYEARHRHREVGAFVQRSYVCLIFL